MDNGIKSKLVRHFSYPSFYVLTKRIIIIYLIQPNFFSIIQAFRSKLGFTIGLPKFLSQRIRRKLLVQSNVPSISEFYYYIFLAELNLLIINLYVFEEHSSFHATFSLCNSIKNYALLRFHLELFFGRCKAAKKPSFRRILKISK